MKDKPWIEDYNILREEDMIDTGIEINFDRSGLEEFDAELERSNEELRNTHHEELLKWLTEDNYDERDFIQEENHSHTELIISQEDFEGI